MKYKKSTLPNGLRLITVPSHGNPSATVMVLVETGSSYEKKSENGISHFLEHMLFKGTANRPTSLDISKEMDSIGAESNAFTSNEVTGYWAKAEKKHLSKLIEILSDMYLNPALPEPELEKERGVILQEISMYEDLHQIKVQEVLGKLLYGDTSHGRTILGPKENIKNLKRKDFVSYRKKHYIAEKTIVVVAGDIDEKEVKKEISKAFKDVVKGKKPKKEKIVEKQKTPAFTVYKKKTDQTHMVIAFRTFGASSKKVAALTVLSGVLGKGMSSRLFQKMREELGACYYVKARNGEDTDHGLLTISTGIESRRIEEVTKALIEECRKIRDEGISEEELQKAKDYIAGHMYLGLETSDSLAEFYVEQEILTGNIKNPNEVEKEIRSVTANDVQNVAKEVFQNKNLNMAVVGDIKNPSKIQKILTF